MPSYLVIRLVPDSPVDGATFATYLEDLRLQVIDANTLLPRSGLAYSSPMIMVEDPVAGWIATVSAPTNSPTGYGGSANDYGSQLTFDSTDGISVGSYVFSAD